MKLEIEDSKVLEAAKKCPAAKEVLETLFPGVFHQKFRVGDIVKYAGVSYLSLSPGMVGKAVTCIDGSLGSMVGVEFQKPIDGHNCGGHGKPPHCLYLDTTHLELVYRQPV